MAGCRHGPEMGTHRGDGRWTAPAGGHTRSVSSLGSPGAVPGVVWAFERFSAGAADAARFALFQTKPGNPEEFFRLPAKELRLGIGPTSKLGPPGVARLRARESYGSHYYLL